MQKLRTKLDITFIKAKNWISTKKEGSDQLMVMFIIIAVAGVVGLLLREALIAKWVLFIIKSLHKKVQMHKK